MRIPNQKRSNQDAPEDLPWHNYNPAQIVLCSVSCHKSVPYNFVLFFFFCFIQSLTTMWLGRNLKTLSEELVRTWSSVKPPLYIPHATILLLFYHCIIFYSASYSCCFLVFIHVYCMMFSRECHSCRYQSRLKQ